MLRFKILASAVPLIVAAVFARGEFSTGSRPCIAIDGASVQIASLPWQAQLQVSFTSDPSTATVRVQISESAGATDFAVVDDVDSAEDGACAANAATRFVAIAANPLKSAPMIYLSADGPARLSDFCALEAIYGARCGSPGCRRRQDTEPPCRRLALRRLNALSTMFSSDSATSHRLKHFFKITAAWLSAAHGARRGTLMPVAPGDHAARRQSQGSWRWGGFSGSRCAYVVSRDVTHGSLLRSARS
jgi:hypothetical protein